MLALRAAPAPLAAPVLPVGPMPLVVPPVLATLAALGRLVVQVVLVLPAM